MKITKLKLARETKLLLMKPTTVPERKTKKKLNKRQRSIKKKLKGLVKKKSISSEVSEVLVDTKTQKKHSQVLGNSGNIYCNESCSSSCLLMPSKKLSTDQTDIGDKQNAFSQLPCDIKNPQNYSANWEKLKLILQENNKCEEKIDKTKYKKAGLSHNVSEESGKFENDESKAHKKSSKIKVKKETINNPNTVINEELNSSKTNVVALDCEMVGGGFKGEDNILARVSIVDHSGTVLYDQHVKPQERITDYRTHVSGIRPADLKNAKSYSAAIKEVSDILRGCIIVGHALSNDFKCLLMSPPRYMIRDTSKFKPFIKLFNGGTPSLKKLSAKLLGIDIQVGEHNSVEDARAAMQIYLLHRKEFEENFNKKLSRGRTRCNRSNKLKKLNVNKTS